MEKGTYIYDLESIHWIQVLFLLNYLLNKYFIEHLYIPGIVIDAEDIVIIENLVPAFLSKIKL